MKTKKKKNLIIAILVILAALISAVIFFLNRRGQTDIIIDEVIPRITVTSSAFENLGAMPDKYTGKGEDLSPGLELSEVSVKANSIAVIMDDIDHPLQPNYNHWVIWNIPPVDNIPEGISHGENVSELDGAVQGLGYGKNRYRGPMPPFGTHRYQFHVFVLDTMLDLDSSSGKADLLNAVKGHILQYGSITGWYPNAE